MTLDNVELNIDAIQLIPLITAYLEVDDINVDYDDNIEKIKVILSNKKRANELIHEYMNVDTEYAILVLNHLFPELFTQKRFLNKVRRVLG